MRGYKKWVKKYLLVLLLLNSAIIGLNYLVDPLQFYRKALYSPHFSDNQRFQNPGLAKNYEYDTIILGTSMAENFVPSYIEEKLGFKTIKLAMSGATSKEQAVMAEFAMKTGKVENVIWCIDYFAIAGGSEKLRSDKEFPMYLYDSNPLNDIRYLFNKDTLRDSLKITLKLGENNDNLELLNNWNDYFSDQFNRERVLEVYSDFVEEHFARYNKNEFAYAYLKASLDKNIIRIIKENEDINFYLYFPPYSILQQYTYYATDKTLFENELKTKAYFFDQVKNLSNAKVYDFQSDANITFNLDNYKDTIHHSQKMNEYIIDSMAANQYLVTSENIKKNADALKSQVEQYQSPVVINTE